MTNHMTNKGERPYVSDVRRPLFPRWYSDEMRKMSSETELFRGLNRIEEQQVRKYPAGSYIFMPGAPTPEMIYILKEGRIEMFRLSSDGKRLTTGEIFPGTVIGLRGVLARATQKNFAQAVEDSTISTISKEQFIKYLNSNPALAVRLLENSYQLVSMLEERLIAVTYVSVRLRLADFLLNNINDDSEILSNFTQEEIGNTIGAARQVVTKHLSMMRKEGLLTTKPKEIKVIDRRGLEQILNNWDS
jgi:CRP/FNR family cyclic AMP-dependent transcriptional regulator